MRKSKFKRTREPKSEEACAVRKDESSNAEPRSMSIYKSKSEVARIREQIEQEYRAAEFLRSGLSITARHAFITARMNNIGRYRKQLVPLVGEDEATRMMCESCAKAENEEGGRE
jgi:hypothetical protein